MPLRSMEVLSVLGGDDDPDDDDPEEGDLDSELTTPEEGEEEKVGSSEESDRNLAAALELCRDDSLEGEGEEVEYESTESERNMAAALAIEEEVNFPSPGGTEIRSPDNDSSDHAPMAGSRDNPYSSETRRAWARIYPHIVRRARARAQEAYRYAAARWFLFNRRDMEQYRRYADTIPWANQPLMEDTLVRAEVSGMSARDEREQLLMAQDEYDRVYYRVGRRHARRYGIPRDIRG